MSTIVFHPPTLTNRLRFRSSMIRLLQHVDAQLPFRHFPGALQRSPTQTLTPTTKIERWSALPGRTRRRPSSPVTGLRPGCRIRRPAPGPPS